VPAKEGLNAHAVLIDELHAQPNRQMWDTLRYAGASRRQPLHLSITTAGFDRHSICWEQHDYAEKVLDGTIDDPSFFAFIAAAAPDDDWTSPEVWKKANPSFGITIISFVFIGPFDSPRTFAAASRQLSFTSVLAAGFFALGVFAAFGVLVVFFVDMVHLLRGGVRHLPRGDHRPPSGAADPTANRSGQLPLCRGHLKRCRSEFLLDLKGF
jgi:hypothetical protein